MWSCYQLIITFVTSAYRRGVAIGEKVNLISCCLYLRTADRCPKDHIFLQAASGWLRIVPWGIRKLMNHIKDKYGNPLVMITENGKKCHPTETIFRISLLP